MAFDDVHIVSIDTSCAPNAELALRHLQLYIACREESGNDLRDWAALPYRKLATKWYPPTSHALLKHDVRVYLDQVFNRCISTKCSSVIFAISEYSRT